eukprot:4948866-Alexandrium_andersonii.AAC.1
MHPWGWSMLSSGICCGATLGTPSEPPEQPLSSSDSASARTMAQNAPLGRFGDQFGSHSWPAQFTLRAPDGI